MSTKPTICHQSSDHFRSRKGAVFASLDQFTILHHKKVQSQVQHLLSKEEINHRELTSMSKQDDNHHNFTHP